LVKDKIYNFIWDTLLLKQRELTVKTPLSGLLDSIKYLRLITYVEKEFGIKVTVADFESKIFFSIETVEDFIRKKLAE
jgi:acyl carrier protein